MFYRYRCEAEIYPTLSRIPLHVRMKLDLTGVKISLKTWLAFSLEERGVLCHLPVETEEEARAFSAYLDFLSSKYLGGPAGKTPPIDDSLWTALDEIPEVVATKSDHAGQPVKLAEWKRWNDYQRYALYKLALSKNEPEQFFAALEEFRQVDQGAH
jgi:hypothetical protein